MSRPVMIRDMIRLCQGAILNSLSGKGGRHSGLFENVEWSELTSQRIHVQRAVERRSRQILGDLLLGAWERINVAR